jgi:ABC-type transport system involved in cytochrome bd biosynthesis fused ATPase/permease subunit
MSWWTTGRVILVTICGCVVVATVGNQINEALANASAQKTKRLATKDEASVELQREIRLQRQAEADRARYEAEKASMECACDQCVNFADANELKKAEQEVG